MTRDFLADPPLTLDFRYSELPLALSIDDAVSYWFPSEAKVTWERPAGG